MSLSKSAKPVQSLTPVAMNHIAFVGRLAGVIACLWIILAGPAALADGLWQGSWATTYGQVQLRQDGRRVWGDYVAQEGVIEARTSEDGRNLRGTYLRGDQSWGWFHFSLAEDGTSWKGSWRARDLPQPYDTAWNANARTSGSAPALRYANGPGPFWPPTYAGAPFGTHGQFVFGPSGRDPHDRSSVSPVITAPSGDWLGDYMTELTPYGFGLSVNLDDTIGGRSPRVELAAFAPDGWSQDAERLCPSAMHPSFCGDLHARFGPDVSTRKTMQITHLGSLVDGNRVLFAFLLSGDAAPRLLALTRTGPDVRLQVWHPNRGVDLDTFVRKSPHLCAGGMSCDPSRGSPTDLQPGPLSSASFVNAYMQLPDSRAAAHAALVPVAPPQGQGRFSEGLYELLGADDSQIGMLDLLISPDGILYGTGDIYPTGALAGQSLIPVTIATEHNAGDSFQLALTPSDGPARDTLRLLISPAGDGTWQGTLIRGDDWQMVTLSDGAGMFDLPGIGVYGPSYALRNTGGQAAMLREAPRSDAAQVGMVAANVRNLLVLGCTPDIDSLLWEQSNNTARHRMLDNVWCEVRHDRQLPGWIPGYFLAPIQQ